jgi:hypothetical protein
VIDMWQAWKAQRWTCHEMPLSYYWISHWEIPIKNRHQRWKAPNNGELSIAMCDFRRAHLISGRNYFGKPFEDHPK